MQLEHVLTIRQSTARRQTVTIVARQDLLYLHHGVVDEVESDWADGGLGPVAIRGLVDPVRRVGRASLREARTTDFVIALPEGALLGVGDGRLVKDALGDSLVLPLALLEHLLQPLDFFVLLRQDCDEVV